MIFVSRKYVYLDSNTLDIAVDTRTMKAQVRNLHHVNVFTLKDFERVYHIRMPF